MFEKKKLSKKDVYELRLWLLNLSDRLEAKDSTGDKLIYKLGRQSEKLKTESVAFEDEMKDLRVQFGTLKDGGFVVEAGSDNYDKFEKAFNKKKLEEVEVDFLSRKIEESELESVKGISIKDFDFLNYFM